MQQEELTHEDLMELEARRKDAERQEEEVIPAEPGRSQSLEQELG